MKLSEQAQQILLNTAWHAIQARLQNQPRKHPIVEDYAAELQQQAACFVTLEKHQQLRGCIGHLHATQALIMDVYENAQSAAFRDPRFPAVQANEFNDLSLAISVLMPATAITFSNEADLIRQIRPGTDGLILLDGDKKATFLPSVWDALETPEEFLQHLKQKAGLTKHYWSDNVMVSRYTTFSIKSDHAPVD